MKNPAINGISNKKFWNVAFEFWHIEFEILGISLETRVLMNFSVRVFWSILKDFWSKYQVWNTGFFIWNTIHFEIMSQSNTVQLVLRLSFSYFRFIRSETEILCWYLCKAMQSITAANWSTWWIIWVIFSWDIRYDMTFSIYTYTCRGM